MERISYSPETLFHVLTHFETADEALRDSLRRAGFTDEAIDGQLRMPGSKFLRTFALSPQEAIARLQRDFPESFTALHPGNRQPGAPVVPLRRTHRNERTGSRRGVDARRAGCGSQHPAQRMPCPHGPHLPHDLHRSLPTDPRTHRGGRVCPAHALSRGTRPSPSPAGEAPDPFWATHLLIEFN